MRYGMPRKTRMMPATVGRPGQPQTGMTWTRPMMLVLSRMTAEIEICYELHLMWEYWLLI